LPEPSSHAAAPSSSAAPVSRSGSPPAPTAGAPPACATRPGSSPPQTHTPTESARIAPPWLSSPTPASRPKLTLKYRVEVCCAQGGPKQTAEVDHFRMPKSSVIYVPYYDPYVVFAPPRPGFVVATAIHFGPAVTIGAAFGTWGWWFGSGILWPSHANLIDHRPWERVWVGRDVYVHPYAHPWVHPVGPRVEVHHPKR